MAPLLPKGTIIHIISWFDGTSKNANNIEARNNTVWGRRSVANMFGTENRVIFLTDEQDPRGAREAEGIQPADE